MWKQPWTWTWTEFNPLALNLVSFTFSDLPGFYFDPEKNRYFRLLPGHNNCNPLTREMLEKKEQESKRTKLLAEDEQSRKVSVGAHRRAVWHTARSGECVSSWNASLWPCAESSTLRTELHAAAAEETPGRAAPGLLLQVRCQGATPYATHTTALLSVLHSEENPIT